MDMASDAFSSSMLHLHGNGWKKDIKVNHRSSALIPRSSDEIKNVTAGAGEYNFSYLLANHNQIALLPVPLNCLPTPCGKKTINYQLLILQEVIRRVMELCSTLMGGFQTNQIPCLPQQKMKPFQQISIKTRKKSGFVNNMNMLSSSSSSRIKTNINFGLRSNPLLISNNFFKKQQRDNVVVLRSSSSAFRELGLETEAFLESFDGDFQDILPPTHPTRIRIESILVVIIDALNVGLKLKHKCTVSGQDVSDYRTTPLLKMELVADYVGIMLMASAGYDPRQVVENLSRCKDSSSDHNFFASNHPSPKKVVGYLRHMILEEAVLVYQQVKAAGHEEEEEEKSNKFVQEDRDSIPSSTVGEETIVDKKLKTSHCSLWERLYRKLSSFFVS